MEWFQYQEGSFPLQQMAAKSSDYQITLINLAISATLTSSLYAIFVPLNQEMLLHINSGVARRELFLRTSWKSLEN